jgi:ABC-type transport system involved in cytochrome c biogenesis permease subunit
MTDRSYIWLALIFYGISGVLTVDRLRRSDPSPATHRLNYLTMLIGFGLQFAFLSLRGQAAHRCPLTNSFETTIFISWAAVMFYLVIGPAYRVSFLGAFTSPVALLISLIALLGLDDSAQAVIASRSPWVDFHAAIAILSYGAFGLAAITGSMYLVQESQLKSRKLRSSFLLLPSIEQLDLINMRLTILGFAMLTIGMFGGVVSYRIIGHWSSPKIIWAVAIWLLYAVLATGRHLWSLRGRRIAWASVWSFVFALVSYWAVGLCPVSK